MTASKNINVPKILVVDENSYWRNFVLDELAQFDVTVYEDVEKNIAEKRFDVAIISSLCNDKLVKRILEHHCEKTIVTTVSPTTSGAISAYKKGACRYICKSFARGDLLSQVLELI